MMQTLVIICLRPAIAIVNAIVRARNIPPEAQQQRTHGTTGTLIATWNQKAMVETTVVTLGTSTLISTKIVTIHAHIIIERKAARGLTSTSTARCWASIPRTHYHLSMPSLPDPLAAPPMAWDFLHPQAPMPVMGETSNRGTSPLHNRLGLATRTFSLMYHVSVDG
jgi:hypothetical protein